MDYALVAVLIKPAAKALHALFGQCRQCMELEARNEGVCRLHGGLDEERRKHEADHEEVRGVLGGNGVGVIHFGSRDSQTS